jgi:hypothetical protein
VPYDRHASPYANFPISAVIRAAIWWWVTFAARAAVEPKTLKRRSSSSRPITAAKLLSRLVGELAIELVVTGFGRSGKGKPYFTAIRTDTSQGESCLDGAWLPIFVFLFAGEEFER